LVLYEFVLGIKSRREATDLLAGSLHTSYQNGDRGDFDMGSIDLRLGDCLEVLKTLSDNSVDAIVCDPPYGLEFMGKKWDKFGADTGTTTERWGKEGKTIPSNRVKYHNGIKGQKRFQQFTYDWATECFRVLKPGGHLLAFGGTRTYHRMAVAIEDSDFEVRDMLEWIYFQGFPKSLNVGKQLQKQIENELNKQGIKEIIWK